jgi:hypothetical protein
VSADRRADMLRSLRVALAATFRTIDEALVSGRPIDGQVMVALARRERWTVQYRLGLTDVDVELTEGTRWTGASGYDERYAWENLARRYNERHREPFWNED